MDESPVFMTYYMKSRVLVTTPNRQYIFVTRNNICGAMVEPDDVEFVLNKRGGCCGQSKRGVFRVGSDAERVRWES